MAKGKTKAKPQQQQQADGSADADNSSSADKGKSTDKTKAEAVDAPAAKKNGKKQSTSEGASSSAEAAAAAGSSSGSNKKTKAKKTAANVKKSWSKYFIGKKRLTFAVGIAAGLCMPMLLQYLGFVKVVDVEEMMAPLAHGIDETKLAVREFMTNLNISMEMPDLDAMSVFDNLYNKNKNNKTDITPGLRAAEEGMRMKYPVVFVPGFTSVGLEIWEGEPCLKHYFRQRVWGTSSMVQALLSDKMCWLHHMSLDEKTGLDPKGKKLRAATGLESADYVIGGYWVWGKVIENLAEIGYTSNEMYMASYDWRMSSHSLEQRDKYMTRLKSMFETSLKISGIPAIVLSHSYGGQILYYFLKWVESPNGGNGGVDWCNKHIAGFVNIAGSMLGVPKALSALLSGEFKDTAQLGSMSAALDYYLSPAKRASLMRTWSSLVTMMPKGGNIIWGNTTYAPDDISDKVKGDTGEVLEDCNNDNLDSSPTFGNMVSFMQDVTPPMGNMTSEEAWDTLILPKIGRDYVKEIGEANIVASDIKNLHKHKDYDEPKFWSSPLASSLPYAPDMKIWCMYGVNQNAERGYLYKSSPYLDAETVNGTQADKNETASDLSVPYVINNGYHGNGFSQGMRLTNGDGTVPLISLGFMCNEGWTNQAYPYNPAKIPVTVVEFRHEPQGFSLRGGGKSSDHIDIMGNSEMMYNILKIVSGTGDEIESRIISNIKEIAERVELKPVVDSTFGW